MTQKPYYREATNGQSEYRIGSKWTPSTSYIPEIHGSEELYSTIEYRRVLDKNNPIAVPAFTWPVLRNKQEGVMVLEKEHPIVFYEPPELLTESHVNHLVEYSLDPSKADDEVFKSEVENRNFESALELLQPFHRPFVRAHFNEFNSSNNLPADLRIDGTRNAWMALRDDVIADYFESLLENVNYVTDCTFIPPVPELMRNSDTEDIERLCELNQIMAKCCVGVTNNQVQVGISDFEDGVIGDGIGGEVKPYFHIYGSEDIIRSDGDDVASEILNKLHDIDLEQFAGIAFTLDNPSKLWEGSNRRIRRLETFVKGGLTTVAHEAGIPVISPRFRWFGAFLTDLGVDAYSSLLNGKDRYHTKKPLANLSDEKRKVMQYGATNILEEAREIPVRTESDNREGLKEYLIENDGLDEVDGFEGITKPPDFDEGASNPREAFGEPSKFRKEFRNPWELSHAQKAKEIRKERHKGSQRPGSKYLHSSRTNHDYE